MTINLKVNAQRLTCLTDDYIAADTVNYIDCKFDFSDEWNGFTKTAVFSNGTDNYSVLLEDDKCIIPKEVLSGVFGISVYGTQTDTKYKRITSDVIYITVYDSGYTEGQTPEAPTPSVYEEISARYTDCKKRLESCEHELEKQTASKVKFIPHTTSSGNPIITADALADEQPLELRVYGCKNLIPYPFRQSTITKQGITFTDNGDGTITLDGTATATVTYTLHHVIEKWCIPKDIYTLSGHPGKSAAGTALVLAPYKNGAPQATYYNSNTDGKLIDLTSIDYDSITVFISITNGTVCDNVTFKPQLELGTAATAYEINKGIGDLNNDKYEISVKIAGSDMLDVSKEQTLTALLDTPLSSNEYIDLVSKKRNGETDITVNGSIALYDGANTVTCETATAPSKLEISYFQDINRVLAELKNVS